MRKIIAPFAVLAAVYFGSPFCVTADEPMRMESYEITGNQVRVGIRPMAGAEVLRILTSSNLNSGFTVNASSSDAYVAPTTSDVTNALRVGPLIGFDWTNVHTAGELFVRAQVVPISQEKLVTSIALNRLAYGPTPYELARILGTNAQGQIGGPGATGGIGIDAWINEQLNPHLLDEDVTNQFAAIAPIYNRFGDRATVVLTNQAGSGETNQPGTLSFHDFKAWFVMHAVGARRQLLEVLLHFMENHFVSSWTIARQTFQGRYNGVGGDIQNRIPTQMEAEEHKAYRAALLNPNITFRELLRLQHESTSMTVYLDTNDSVGSGNNVANENYAREIMELYSMGVDNGYDQGDITALSLAWTGWDVQKVSPANAYNLIAHETSPLQPPQASNSYGVYALQFRSSRHGNSNLFLWYHRNSVGAPGNNYPNGQVVAGTAGFKKVEPRFNGSGMTPAYNYTDKLYGTNTVPGSYALFLPSTQTGTNANLAARTNKVYVAMDHMADLPYTQEFLSVKLCRLLVHDNFHIGYDFSDGVVTPEEQLVWDCMMAWETSNPKGQIWKVVKTITDSALFRSQAAASRKIKTPLEFCVSAVRALRHSSNGTFTAAGGFTANSDGYAIASGNAAQSVAHPLNRMGRYLIFDREEPDGYPETGTVYVGANGLSERNRWLHSILNATPTADGIAGGNNTRTDPVGLARQFIPANSLTDADVVVRFFLTVLYPGEGGANLDYYRRLAINTLNTSDTGSLSLFGLLSPTSTAYDTRVRRMVALLMSMPTFHEQ